MSNSSTGHGGRPVLEIRGLALAPTAPPLDLRLTAGTIVSVSDDASCDAALRLIRILAGVRDVPTGARVLPRARTWKQRFAGAQGRIVHTGFMAPVSAHASSTVEEYLLAPLAACGEVADADHLDALLSRSGLRPLLAQRLDTLAATEAVVLTLTAALTLRPHLVVMEHPFVGLDDGEAEFTLETLRRLLPSETALVHLAASARDAALADTAHVLTSTGELHVLPAPSISAVDRLRRTAQRTDDADPRPDDLTASTRPVTEPVAVPTGEKMGSGTTSAPAAVPPPEIPEETAPTSPTWTEAFLEDRSSMDERTPAPARPRWAPLSSVRSDLPERPIPEATPNPGTTVPGPPAERTPAPTDLPLRLTQRLTPPPVATPTPRSTDELPPIPSAFPTRPLDRVEAVEAPAPHPTPEEPVAAADARDHDVPDVVEPAATPEEPSAGTAPIEEVNPSPTTSAPVDLDWIEDPVTQEITVLAVERLREMEIARAAAEAAPDSLREELVGGEEDPLPPPSVEVIDRATRILTDLPGPVMPTE